MCLRLATRKVLSCQITCIAINCPVLMEGSDYMFLMFYIELYLRQRSVWPLMLKCDSYLRSVFHKASKLFLIRCSLPTKFKLSSTPLLI